METSWHGRLETMKAMYSTTQNRQGEGKEDQHKSMRSKKQKSHKDIQSTKRQPV